MTDDRKTPATKGDLYDLRSEFKTGLNNLRDELLEAIHDSQTALLKAFYGFTEAVQNRFKDKDEAEAALKRRMNTLESRVLEIEKRLNMPPSAA
jgi:hypothetical protein